MPAYRMIEYIMGRVERTLVTRDADKARQFYRERDVDTSSVRVWVDGVRLKYAESDELFRYTDWVGHTKGRHK